MTSLPEQPSPRRLGLVIDLDICVGCHACAVNCKEWNSGGVSAPLTDLLPYDAEPDGVWFNRVHTYEVGEGAEGRTVHFPRSCLHCAEPACVAPCPASARHFGDLGDPTSDVSRLVAERGGYDLMPEMGYAPTNKYLPPRARQQSAGCTGAPEKLAPAGPAPGGLLGWLDR